MAEKPKIPLENFQQWMQQMLLDPFQKTESKAADLLPKELEYKSLDAIVNSSQKIGAAAHLAIYQRSYIARLRSCMAQQFSALEFALGEDLFRSFADMYLAENPSVNYNLSHLGDSFTEFLQQQRPDAKESIKESWIDFMIELATFENELNKIFDCETNEAFVLADSLTKEIDLVLASTMRVYCHQFPISWFYTQFKSDKEPQLPAEKKSYCVVLRVNYRLALYDLNEAQYFFLSQCLDGETIKDAKAKTRDHFKIELQAFDEIWNAWKVKWLKCGFLIVNE